MKSNELTHKQVSKKGGDTTYKKRGKSHYSQMGVKSSESKKKKWSPEYYKEYHKELSRKMVEARKRKRENSA